MSSPQPDTAYSLAEALLAYVLARMETAGVAVPKRAFVCGEDALPADDCCKGLVWTRVASIFGTDGSGAPFARLLPMPATTPPGHVIILEVGALRCAPVVDPRGKPPAPDLYTASALASAADRSAVRLAVECDLPASIAELNCDGQIVGQWLPIYNGECAGGFMTTQVVTTMVL